MNGRTTVVLLSLALTQILFAAPGIAQITQSDLREFSERAASKGIFRLPEPTFDWTTSYLRYKLPAAIPAPETLVYEKRALLDVVLNEQLRVTGIRAYRREESQRQFWRPVLAKVEREIASMLDVINAGDLRKAEADQVIEGILAKIGDIYASELGSLAQSKGKLGAITEVRVYKYFVSISTQPPGATIRYMPAGQWELYLFLKDQHRQNEYPMPNWITLTQTEGVPLFGYNWFHVRWEQDGTERTELVSVLSSNALVFKEPSR